MLFHLVIMVFLSEVMTNRLRISRPSGNPCLISDFLKKMHQLRWHIENREFSTLSFYFTQNVDPEVRV